MEELVQEGKIQNYGVSSYAAFRQSSLSQFYMNLENVYEIAQRVGGDKNNFNYVAAPVSVVMPEAYIEEHQFVKSRACYLVQAAEHFKINLMTTQPLYGGLLSQTPLSTGQLLSKHLHAKHLNLIR